MSGTMPSGVTVTVGFGATALLAGGKTLTVNGTLNVTNAANFAVDQSSYGAVEAIYVNGTMAVTNTQLTNLGGQNNNQVSLIQVNAGAHFTATDTIFAWDDLILANDSILGHITGNGFDTSLFVPAIDVPLLTDNLRFDAVNIDGGTLSGQNVTLPVMGTQTSAHLYYDFSASFTVGSGATLNIAPGVIAVLGGAQTLTVNGMLNVSNASGFYVDQSGYAQNESIFVNGAMTVANTPFTLLGGQNNLDTSLIQVNAGGRLLATDSIFDWNNLTLTSGSNDTLRFCGFAAQLNVNSGAALNIVENDFTHISANGIVATGSASSNIDMKSNYWGTTDATQIAAKILDHSQDASRPTVLYIPFLGALPPYRLALIGLGPTTAGRAMNIKVDVDDMYGNLLPSYTGTVQFSSSDSMAVYPGPYTFTSADQGVHAFSVTFETAGLQTLTVTDTVTSSLAGQGSVAVAPAAAAHCSLAGVPSTTTAGNPFSVTVTVTDAYGNLATSYTGTLHWTSTDSAAVLPPDYTFTAADHGTHAFPITLTTAGPQTLSATDTLTGSLTTQAGVTVTPAATTRFALSAPANVTANVAFNVTVVAEDAYANTTTNYTGTVRFGSTDPAAVLPDHYTFTAGDAGAHTFLVTLKNDGVQSVSATDTTLSSLTGSATVNDTGLFKITAPANVTAGAPFSITVTALNGLGTTATNYTGTVQFTSSDHHATLPAHYRFTPADQGVHVFTSAVTLFTAGNQTVTAADTVNAPSTASATIAVTASPATHFRISAPASKTAGAPFVFTVAALDAFNNLARTYTGTVHFTSSDPLAGLPADATFTLASNGSLTLAAIFYTAASQSLTATDTATPTITGMASVTVAPAAISHFAIAAPLTSAAGAAFSVTVTALDRFNNLATAFNGTIHFKSSDKHATLPADYQFTAADAGVHTFSGVTLQTAGNQTLTVIVKAFPAVNGTTTIPINPLAVTHFGVSMPAKGTAGVAFTVTVSALDPFNNVVPSYTGTIQFSSTDPQQTLPANYAFAPANNGVETFILGVTFRTAGTQTLTIADLADTTLTGTANSTIAAAPATHFLITAPSTAVKGTPFVITITAYDPFNNIATAYLGTIHFTSSDPTAKLPLDYTFTAGNKGTRSFQVVLKTLGSQTITATDTANSTITGNATVTVSSPAPLFQLDDSPWLLAADPRRPASPC
jgi:hypothetical protein